MRCYKRKWKFRWWCISHWSVYGFFRTLSRFSQVLSLLLQLLQESRLLCSLTEHSVYNKFKVWCLKQMKDLMWAADVLFPANTGCISICSEHEHSLHYIPCISLPMQQSHNAINIMLYHFHLPRPYLFMFFETIQMRSVSGWDLGWLGRTFGTMWRSMWRHSKRCMLKIYLESYQKCLKSALNL